MIVIPDMHCFDPYVGLTQVVKDSFMCRVHSFKTPLQAYESSPGLCCLSLALSYNSMGVSRAASILASRVSGVIHALLCARSSSRLAVTARDVGIYVSACTVHGALAVICMQPKRRAMHNPKSNAQGKLHFRRRIYTFIQTKARHSHDF